VTRLALALMSPPVARARCYPRPAMAWRLRRRADQGRRISIASRPGRTARPPPAWRRREW